MSILHMAIFVYMATQHKSPLENECCGVETYVQALYRVWYDIRFVGTKAAFRCWETNALIHVVVAGTKRDSTLLCFFMLLSSRRQTAI